MDTKILNFKERCLENGSIYNINRKYIIHSFTDSIRIYIKEKNWFSDSFSGNISKLIMNIALPASIFVSVLKYLTLKSLLSLTGALVYTFLSVIIGYIFAYILVKILNVPVGRKGTFINTVVNANTIFIGLPLNIALFGNESLPYF